MMLIQKCGGIVRVQPRAQCIFGLVSLRNYNGGGRSPYSRRGHFMLNAEDHYSGLQPNGLPDKPRYYGERPRQRGSSDRGFQRGGQSNSYSGRGGNKGNRNSSFRNGSSRSFADDEADVMERTKGRRSKDDGLMGLPDYELNRDLADMTWTQLIPENAGSVEEYASQGVSQIPIQALADHRLLSAALVNSLLHNRKYERLTPVQAQTLLPILRGESCVVRAKTGTGKTAAFSVPAIQKVLEAKKQGLNEGKVKAIIITPTRELAQQIADEVYKIISFGGLNHIKVQSLVGGLSKGAQMRASGLTETSRDRDVADIIVATPGRLRDILLESKVPERFNELKFTVFDEADRILDIGFEGDVNEISDIIKRASKPKHETPLLLFSATADRNVMRFAQNQFGDRVKLVDTVPKDEPTANELVNQVAVACSTWADVYEGATREILEGYEKAQANETHFKAIVFLPTTIMVDHFEELLSNAFDYRSNIRRNIYAVHGQRKQATRLNRSDMFRKQKNAILLTTDVVARGMDFPQVSHVFQLGIPPDVSSYVHRIGRTARIGNSGDSFLYYTNHLRAYINALERENIKPKMQLFEPNEEFHLRFLEMFARSVSKDDDAKQLVQSLMSYMTVLKSKYHIDRPEFMRDMTPFAELMGVSELPLSTTMRQTWLPKKSTKSRRGFGSSRKTRMRW